MGRGTIDRATARRAQILAAAGRCFARDGFHRATMPEIAAEAGISAGLIYRYFPAKDAIVAAIAEDFSAAVLGLLRESAAAGDPLSAIDALFTAAAAPDPRSTADLMNDVFAEAVRNERVRAVVADHDARVLAGISAVLRAGQAAGAVDPALDPAAAAVAVSALWGDVFVQATLYPGDDLAARAATLAAFARRALAPRP